MNLALEILEKAKAKGVKFTYLSDVVAADAFNNEANTQICDVESIFRWLARSGCRTKNY